jgi:hypothetical protein
LIVFSELQSALATFRRHDTFEFFIIFPKDKEPSLGEIDTQMSTIVIL